MTNWIFMILVSLFCILNAQSDTNDSDQTLIIVSMVGFGVIFVVIICAILIHKSFQRDAHDLVPHLSVDDTLIGRNPDTPKMYEMGNSAPKEEQTKLIIKNKDAQNDAIIEEIRNKLERQKKENEENKQETQDETETTKQSQPENEKVMEAAWNNEHSEEDDSIGLQEEYDDVQDLQTVEIEMNKRAIHTQKPNNRGDATPESTRL